MSLCHQPTHNYCNTHVILHEFRINRSVLYTAAKIAVSHDTDNHGCDANNGTQKARAASMPRKHTSQNASLSSAGKLRCLISKANSPTRTGLTNAWFDFHPTHPHLLSTLCEDKAEKAALATARVCISFPPRQRRPKANF